MTSVEVEERTLWPHTGRLRAAAVLRPGGDGKVGRGIECGGRGGVWGGGSKQGSERARERGSEGARERGEKGEGGSQGLGAETEHDITG